MKLAVALLSLVSFQDDAPLTHGPLLGAVTPTAAVVWARASAPGSLVLRLHAGAREVAVVAAEADPRSDLCVRWALAGLAPATEYRYAIEGGAWHCFVTAPPDEQPARVSVAFGSCADDRRFPAQPIWTRIAESGAEALVLLGDTPYVDSTELEVQRRRYREIYSVPELAALVPRIPVYSTWDDHDFGRNDTNGLLAGKERSLRVFTEYHPNPTFGGEGAGVYTRFRRGPLEVFVLDTRWFAATEPSPFDAERPTLLGAAQWRWLQEGLTRSTATFKVLASGMVWNGAVRPLKTDHWAHYPHERDALFALVVREKIDGVVLVGGDIHRSRALRHALPGSERTLVELITSPLANFVIEAANQPHPGLLADMGVDQSFLLLTADSRANPPTLHARFVGVEGETLYALQVQ